MSDEIVYDFTSIDYLEKDVIPLYETITPDGYDPIKIDVQLTETNETI